MGGNEDLDTTLRDLQDRSGYGLDDLRIEVGFRFIPEKVTLVEKRARRDETGESRELAQTLGDDDELLFDDAIGSLTETLDAIGSFLVAKPQAGSDL